jgi:hypothetical protein
VGLLRDRARTCLILTVAAALLRDVQEHGWPAVPAHDSVSPSVLKSPEVSLIASGVGSWMLKLPL